MENELIYGVKSIVVLIMIIAAANYLLKFLNGFMTKKGKFINVIERMPLNRTSSLCIVEVSGKYYLMSCTDTRNEILKELEQEDVQTEKKTGMQSFVRDSGLGSEMDREEHHPPVRFRKEKRNRSV